MRSAKTAYEQNQNSQKTQTREDGQALPALLLNVDELAGTLGVSKRTAWRLDASGRVPNAIRIGGLKRWRRDEIIDWIADGCPHRRNWSWEGQRGSGSRDEKGRKSR